jgi:hypothetical protein
VYVLSSGSRFDGEWLNGKKNGKGIYSSSFEIRKGIWKDGKHLKYLKNNVDETVPQK